MPYIGKTPTVGNFQVCDAISVVNGQAAYTLQVGGANVAPESANHMLVSLNGVLQKPGSSFSISGSTMTFASNLATGDVIDFVQILGNVLDLGQPSDDTVTAAKLNNDIISGQTALSSAPADTDELLISDAGTLKRIDYSLLKSTPGLNLLSTTTISSGTSTVDMTGMDSTYVNYKIVGSQIHPATDNVALNGRVIIGGSAQTGSDYPYVNHFIKHSGTPSHVLNSSSDATSWKLTYGSAGNATEENLSFEMDIYNPSDTSLYKTFTTISTGLDNAGGDIYMNINGAAYRGSTSAITGVQFFMSSGNIDSAVFKIYGIS